MFKLVKISKTLFICLVFLLIISSGVLSQTPKSSSLIGVRVSGKFQNYLSQGNRILYYQFNFEPYYMFFVKENLGLGIIGEIDFAGGNQKYLDYPELIYGVGAVTRFYYPIQIEKSLFQYFRFYAESSLSFSNYYIENETFVYSNNRKINYSIFRIIPFGATINLNKGLNFELSPIIFKYFPGDWMLSMNFGLEYHFGK